MENEAGRHPETPNDAADAADGAPPRAQLVAWVDNGPVCVTIAESPPRTVRDTACHCEACRAAQYADWAARFI